ncbi:MAG: hypothetical protein HUU15_12815 [Candidatus Brocadiae bacterium]|nr:hypothetical protein [Candidatus Brocadiia bacterium]
MNRLFTVIATGAILGAAGLNAQAENFFKKVSRKVKESHERHVDMMADAHDRHVRIARDAHRHEERRVVIRHGECGYGEGHGRWETIEVQECIPGYYRTEYVEVHTPGHYETRVVDEVVPGYFKQVWVEPVFRYETDCHGHRIKIQVSCGYFKKVWIPPTTCRKTVRVFVEGECRRVPKKVWVEEQHVTKCVRVWVVCR